MKYVIRAMLLVLLLIMTPGMTEKQILGLILIAVVYISWHCTDRE